MSKHLERAEKWMFERDDVDDSTSLAALLAEVENEALERAARQCEETLGSVIPCDEYWETMKEAGYLCASHVRALKEPK